jgi:Flp pilus assembly protein TadG
MLVAAVVEIVLVANDQLRLSHAAREAARVAVVDPDRDAAARTVADQGFDGAAVSVSPATSERRQGDPLTVSVAYERPARVPVIGSVFAGLELQARATMRIEQP